MFSSIPCVVGLSISAATNAAFRACFLAILLGKASPALFICTRLACLTFIRCFACHFFWPSLFFSTSFFCLCLCLALYSLQFGLPSIFEDSRISYNCNLFLLEVRVDHLRLSHVKHDQGSSSHTHTHTTVTTTTTTTTTTSPLNIR